MAWLIPAITAASAIGSALMGSKKVKYPKASQIDISGELAKLDAIYEQSRQQSQNVLRNQLTELNKNTASSLASRGIYSSPISQAAYNQTNRTYQNALSSLLAESYNAQAQARANLTAKLAEARAKAEQDAAVAKYEQKLRNQGVWSNLLGSISGAGLHNMLGAPAQANISQIPQTPQINPNSNIYLGNPFLQTQNRIYPYPNYGII